MQPFAEIIETFGGQGVVVVLPRELSLEVSAGSQGLAGLDDLFNTLKLVEMLAGKKRQEDAVRRGSWCQYLGAWGG